MTIRIPKGKGAATRSARILESIADDIEMAAKEFAKTSMAYGMIFNRSDSSVTPEEFAEMAAYNADCTCHFLEQQIRTYRSFFKPSE